MLKLFWCSINIKIKTKKKESKWHINWRKIFWYPKGKTERNNKQRQINQTSSWEKYIEARKGQKGAIMSKEHIIIKTPPKKGTNWKQKKGWISNRHAWQVRRCTRGRWDPPYVAGRPATRGRWDPPHVAGETRRRLTCTRGRWKNPWPATPKTLTCHAQTLDVPRTNPGPATHTNPGSATHTNPWPATHSCELSIEQMCKLIEKSKYQFWKQMQNEL